jgi:hypothetical protein
MRSARPSRRGSARPGAQWTHGPFYVTIPTGDGREDGKDHPVDTQINYFQKQAVTHPNEFIKGILFQKGLLQ